MVDLREKLAGLVELNREKAGVGTQGAELDARIAAARKATALRVSEGESLSFEPVITQHHLGVMAGGHYLRIGDIKKVINYLTELLALFDAMKEGG